MTTQDSNPDPQNTGNKPEGQSPADPSGRSRAVAVAAGDSSAGSRAGTSFDTILGRMVVDQGFATNTEVQKVLKDKRTDDASSKSLAELLIDQSVVTPNQLARLKGMAEAERSGQQIPGYSIIGKLGAGAMATVFKAKQISLDRTVAIKVLPRRFSNNADFIRRFYAEGRAAATLNHANIVQAFDVGQAGEFHYFVMEYVEGATVHDLVAEKKRLTEARAIEIIIQVAEALEHAHERGLIHRDVKPKNIMLTTSGTAKLADMGLARAVTDLEAAEAEAGKAFGTPYYISPEQIRGEKEITPAADIYSLGATLYNMVTGNVPFDGKSPAEVMKRHLKAPLTPPDHVNPKLSAGISQIIEMMMAKDVRERYQNCHDVITDLKAVQRGEDPVIARQDVPEVSLTGLAEQVQSTEVEIQKDKSRPPLTPQLPDGPGHRRRPRRQRDHQHRALDPPLARQVYPKKINPSSTFSPRVKAG